MDKRYKEVQDILKAEYGSEDYVDPFVPNMQEFIRLRKWVCWADGPDPDGRWIGFCPLHDRRRRSEASAIWDFVKGMYWCNSDPSCHPGQRAISIQNLYIMLATKALV